MLRIPLPKKITTPQTAAKLPPVKMSTVKRTLLNDSPWQAATQNRIGAKLQTLWWKFSATVSVRP